eukprot:8355742-Alexandrium_andersonii.AAC.1
MDPGKTWRPARETEFDAKVSASSPAALVNNCGDATLSRARHATSQALATFSPHAHLSAP